MRRTIVFLLLGPLAVAVSVTMALASQGITSRFSFLAAVVLFVVSLPVSALVGVIDTVLAHRLSIERRAGLTAVAGAIISCALIASEAPALSILLPVAIFGAASMWLCAFLANGPGMYATAFQTEAGLSQRASATARTAGVTT